MNLIENDVKLSAITAFGQKSGSILKLHFETIFDVAWFVIDTSTSDPVYFWKVSSSKQ